MRWKNFSAATGVSELRYVSGVRSAMPFIAVSLVALWSSIELGLTAGAVIRSHNFNDGSLGPYVNPWGV